MKVSFFTKKKEEPVCVCVCTWVRAQMCVCMRERREKARESERERENRGERRSSCCFSLIIPIEEKNFESGVNKLSKETLFYTNFFTSSS